MIPNVIWHHSIGKIMFCFSDILIGYLLKWILEKTTELGWKAISTLVAIWTLNPLVFNVSTRGNADTMVVFVVLAMLVMLL